VSALDRNGDNNMMVSRTKRLFIGAATVGLSLGIGLVGSNSVGAARVDKLESDVFKLPGGNVRVDDASVDARIKGESANISFHTNGLVGGNAYTVWSISFSDPNACSNGSGEQSCGFGDEALSVVQQVGGNIAGASGKLTISGRVEVDNAASAEYHIVLANHGPLDPSTMPLQIKSPGPGVQIGFLVP
jgi:hypothetical protein